MLEAPRFIMWNGEPREIESEADDEHYWLVPSAEASRAFAPKVNCTELPSDQELLIKPVTEMTDAELEMALELAEKQRMTKSDRPAARIGRAKKKIQSDELIVNEQSINFFAELQQAVKEAKENK